uniref:Uncharacterized protein n=1 Tax=Meloidogyne enterolobii TaxID=390850 RepID=A0A6V7VZQ0_MELEN|nr:unnamed protein product [Meloidogyne enterolobii]
MEYIIIYLQLATSICVLPKCERKRIERLLLKIFLVTQRINKHKKNF